MKKVISGNELRVKMVEAINLLCGTVKQTLGPLGRNVIIDHSNFTPFITNDGVTIAENIESDDAVIGSIIEIAKEASIKTNDNVGDGTTTTLVLLESLINLSQEYIELGMSPMILKRELTRILNIILDKLDSIKFEASSNLLKNIACVSASDQDMGEFVSKVLENVDSKAAITIKESSDNSLDVKYIKGYTSSITHACEYYFQDEHHYQFSNAYILIVNDMMHDIESISSILNQVMIENKCLVIIAKEFDEYFVNEIVSMNLENEITCFMVKINEYGLKMQICNKDIEVITGALIVENSSCVSGANIGIAKNIYIDKNNLRIDFINNEKTKTYISKIDLDIEEADDFDKEFYQRRKAMFTNGVANLLVGAPTKIESREKRMRIEDAICAVLSSKNGVLPGGGVSLLRVASLIDDDSEAAIIWKSTLLKPFIQLLENAGIEYEDKLEQIKGRDYKVVYNVSKECYEDIGDTNIVDAFDVVRNSLINASSIAGMLITTNSLVVNEYQNNLEKTSEYSEI